MLTAKAIPEKLFFKIGEVADLVEEEQHVLRYWETEFPMLAPQKNRAGQRTYRKKDVEMAFRIKELLRNEGFTIEGARKKLMLDTRGNARLKVVTPEMAAQIEQDAIEARPASVQLNNDQRRALKKIRRELEAVLMILE